VTGRPPVAEVASPAVPSTPAQHGRRDRILDAATAVLCAGGEDALQMKELAQQAGVSLATLYRYFPAKDHVLLAIVMSRYSRALDRIRRESPRGGSVRERVTAHLLREFRAGQREPRLTAALARAVGETSHSYRATIGQIEAAHLRVIRHVAAGGGDLSPRHDAVRGRLADQDYARRLCPGGCRRERHERHHDECTTHHELEITGRREDGKDFLAPIHLRVFAPF